MPLGTLKSKKILSILHDFIGSDLGELTCIDIGCSSGDISQNIGPNFKSLIGIDVDTAAIIQAASSNECENITFLLAGGHEIPFPSALFDVAICAQVYEHTIHQQLMAKEIWRILRPGGICFFSGPNRLKIMEEHYWLPFLSWLPSTLSHFYMRVFNRGRFYDAYPLSYWQLRELWGAFRIYDYTPNLILNPQRFEMQDVAGKVGLFRRLPSWLIHSLAPLYPNYNWILQKSDENYNDFGG